MRTGSTSIGSESGPSWIPRLASGTRNRRSVARRSRMRFDGPVELFDAETLSRKVARIEALHAGATTAGERAAAADASRRRRPSTSTIAPGGTLVPWLAENGPLAYRP